MAAPDATRYISWETVLQLLRERHIGWYLECK